MSKYYYGNSYKEAISNAAVEISTTKQLEQYMDNYNVVIPEESVLPDEIEINADEIDCDPNDDAELNDVIHDWIVDNYDADVESFDVKKPDHDGDKFIVSNIEWEAGE